MEITKVEVQKNNDDRVNVYVDNKFYSGMYMDTVIKYGLKAGKEIDKDTLDSYILESDKQTAFNKTMTYLKSAMKTRKQVREYLHKKDYSSVTIDYVLDKLSEYGYICDEKYAMSYISTYRHKYGVMRLKTNLIAKGVDKDLVDECIERSYEEDESSSIEQVADKYLKNKEIDEKTISKLIRFLSYRGYEFDKINEYISRIRRGD